MARGVARLDEQLLSTFEVISSNFTTIIYANYISIKID